MLCMWTLGQISEIFWNVRLDRIWFIAETNIQGCCTYHVVLWLQCSVIACACPDECDVTDDTCVCTIYFAVGFQNGIINTHYMLYLTPWKLICCALRYL